MDSDWGISPSILPGEKLTQQRGVSLVEPEALVAESVEAQHRRQNGQHRHATSATARPRGGLAGPPGPLRGACDEHPDSFLTESQSCASRTPVDRDHYQGMRESENSALLAAAASGAAAQARQGLEFGRLDASRARLGALRALRVPSFSARAGYLALGSIFLGVLVTVLLSTSGTGVFVPRAKALFPAWEGGPLHALGVVPGLSASALEIGDSLLLIAMTAAYAIVVLAGRSLSMRAIAIWIVAISAVLLLGPPLQLTDLFNYLGYARLGALHHLDPYTHVIDAETWDPVYALTSWHNLSSPYGPLFTAITYPLAFLSLPARVLDAQDSDRRRLACVPLARRSLREAARAGPAARGAVRRRQPAVHLLRGRRLPQRLLHARALDGRHHAAARTSRPGRGSGTDARGCDQGDGDHAAPFPADRGAAASSPPARPPGPRPRRDPARGPQRLAVRLQHPQPRRIRVAW